MIDQAILALVQDAPLALDDLRAALERQGISTRGDAKLRYPGRQSAIASSWRPELVATVEALCLAGPLAVCQEPDTHRWALRRKPAAAPTLSLSRPQPRATPPMPTNSPNKPAASRRQATPTPVAHIGAERETLRPFATIGEQIHAVVRAGMGDIDPRLKPLAATAAGMNESVASEGGFFVQESLATPILDRAWQIGQILKRVRRVPAGTASRVKLNAFDETSRANGSRLGGIQMYWVDEAATLTSSKPKFRQLDMTLKKLVGLAYSTDELSTDSPAFNATLERAFAEELTFMAEDAIVAGGGIGTLIGLTKSPALITVAAEGGQVAGTIVPNNVVKMFARAYLPAVPDSLVWLVSQDAFPQLLTMTIASGTATVPLYNPTPDADAPYGRLIGRPVVPCESCATLGTVSDIILVDLDQFVVVDQDPKTALSLDFRFIYDEATTRLTYRVDGQGIWAKPVTPKNSSTTISPYVTLAAR